MVVLAIAQRPGSEGVLHVGERHGRVVARPCQRHRHLERVQELASVSPSTCSKVGDRLRLGGGGLGLEAVFGLTKGQVGRGVVAGIAILLLAIVVDRITQAMGMAPRVMRGPVGTGGVGWWSRASAIPTGQAEAASDDVPEDGAEGDDLERKGEA